MSGIRCFFIAPTASKRRSLRRFHGGSDAANPCPGRYGYHNAERALDVVEAFIPAKGEYERACSELEAFAGDPRWPATCDHCAYVFTADDTRQVREERLYSGAPDGRLYSLQDAPVGAMWDAWWMGELWAGPDGICLTVRTPGGDWMVDSEASNCTRPQSQPVEGEPNRYRFVRTHYCWVRHGDPRTEPVHVDKIGDTCAAGAGSIIAGSYHGFLHRGHLVGC